MTPNLSDEQQRNLAALITYWRVIEGKSEQEATAKAWEDLQRELEIDWE